MAFLDDEFTGSGTIVGHTPDTTFGAQSWTAPGSGTALELSGGYAVVASGETVSSSAYLNATNTNYSNPSEIQVDFSFKTGAGILTSLMELTVNTAGETFRVKIYPDLYDPFVYLSFEDLSSGQSAIVQIEGLLTANTDYAGEIYINSDIQTLSFAGQNLRTFVEMTGVGATLFYLKVGAGCGVEYLVANARNTPGFDSANDVRTLAIGGQTVEPTLYDDGDDLSPYTLVPPNAFFADTFNRLGLVEDSASDVTFGAPAASVRCEMRRGYLVENDNAEFYVTVGDETTDFSNPTEFTLILAIKTGPVIAAGAASSFSIRAWVRGVFFDVSVVAVVNELDSEVVDYFASLSIDYTEEDITTAFSLLPNTHYELTLKCSDTVQNATIADKTLSANATFANAIGVSGIQARSGISNKMNAIVAYEGVGDIIDLYKLTSGGIASSGFTSAAINSIGASSAGIAESSADNVVMAINDITDTVVARGFHLDDAPYLVSSGGVVTDSLSSIVNSLHSDAGVMSSIASGLAQSYDDIVSTGLVSDKTSWESSGDVAKSGGVASSLLVGVANLSSDLESGGVASSVELSSLAEMFSDLASGGVLSSIITQHLSANELIIDKAVVRAHAIYDTLMQAWTMNSQTHAMSRYNGLPYRSIAAIGNRLIALGDTGFFELDSDADNGVPVDSMYITGFEKLGTDKLKRLGNVDIGYSTKNAVSVLVREYGDTKLSYTYNLPTRTADAPRGGKVTLGKGLRSKYYQFTIKGQSLNLDYAQVEVFASENRKV